MGLRAARLEVGLRGVKAMTYYSLIVIAGVVIGGSVGAFMMAIVVSGNRR